MIESPYSGSLTSFFVITGAAPVLRSYIRYFPVKTGKVWVWNNVVRPYVAWRPVVVNATTRSGLVLRNVLSDTIHNAVYFFGVWEPALTRYLSDHLKPGDIFIDIGANVGVHAMHAAQCVGASGIVHTVEASQTIFSMLGANIARNGLDNIVMHNLAASDCSGEIEILLHDACNLGASRIMTAGTDVPVGFARRETVQARVLPDIVPVEDLLGAKIIKIDVEGAEWAVLQGLAPVVPRLRQDVSIVVEVDRDALAAGGVSIKQFLAFFETHGFRGARLQDHSAASCIGGKASALLPVPDDFAIADLVFTRTVASEPR